MASNGNLYKLLFVNPPPLTPIQQSHPPSPPSPAHKPATTGMEGLENDLLHLTLLDSTKSSSQNQAVWKLFTHVKDLLPNASRLGN